MYPFELPPLPYPHDALASVISPSTVDAHYDQHHKGYLQKLNEMIKGTPYAEMSLEKIIVETAHDENHRPLFNNAAQFWNHNFYWQSLDPKASHQPVGNLAQAVEKTFGSYEEFSKQFIQAGVEQFGSGWIWLCSDAYGKVQITRSSNAQNPLLMQLKPLLTVDVWEHAYYLDFQSRRADYLEEITARMLNWDFADENYEEV
ncbi:MAG: superoxide dismutase [Pseudobdellovibrionaceae bacterium]